MATIIRKRNKLGQFTKASAWTNIAVIKAIKQMSLKLLALSLVILLIIGLNGGRLSAVGYTAAFYNDTEVSNANLIVAGKLDFILDEESWTPAGEELDLRPGDSVSREITIIDDHGIDFKYIVFPEKTDGNNDFCNALELDARLEGVLQYSGPLFDFLSATTTFSTTTDDWKFNVSLPAISHEFNNKSCRFDFVFSGWQSEFPNEGEGFNDQERSSNIIQSGCHFNESPRGPAGADNQIVINEFLPNPIGFDNAPMPGGEWVELYNLSDAAIDVAGWTLYDNLNSHPVVIASSNSDNNGNTADSGETIVPAGGYLVAYLNGAYSGWLNNSGGDSVRLYSGTVGTAPLRDSYSYAGSAPENKSYARIPDGIGNFIDPIPTPLAPNKIEDDIIAEETVVAPVASSTPIVEETIISEPQPSPEATTGEAEATAVAEEVIVSEPQPSPEATAGEAEIAPNAEETPVKEEDSAADVIITETDET